MNPYLLRIKADKIKKALGDAPSKPSKAPFEPFEGSPPGRIFNFDEMKARHQPDPDARHQASFLAVGRECPMGNPTVDWRPGEIVSAGGAPHLRSTALWCAHCGRFPEQTQEGEVYAVGASFYCAECCKF